MAGTDRKQLEQLNKEALIELVLSQRERLEQMDRNIQLISLQDMISVDAGGFSYGLAQMTEKGPLNLAMPVWQWGIYYETILRRVLNGTFKLEYEESTKALNYYWGLTAGVVDLRCSGLLP